jgi:hypothetical protein
LEAGGRELTSIFRTATTQDFANLYGQTESGQTAFFGANAAEGVDWGLMRFAMRSAAENDAFERMLEQGERPSRTMTEDEWRQSDMYREGIQFDPNKPAYELAALAEAHDQRVRRDAILDDYQGPGQVPLSLGGQFLGGLADPLNFITGVGLAGKAQKLFRGIDTISDIGRMSYRSTFAYEAAENALLIAASEPAIVHSMQQEGSTATMDDVLNDVLIGGAIGGTLGIGRKWLGAQRVAMHERNAAENGVIKALVELDASGTLRDIDIAQPAAGSRILQAARDAREKFSFRNMSEEVGFTNPRDFVRKVLREPINTIRETLSAGKRQFDEALTRARESRLANLSADDRARFDNFERAYSEFMRDLHGMSSRNASRVLDRLKKKLTKLRDAYTASPTVKSVWEHGGPEIDRALPEGAGEAPGPVSRETRPEAGGQPESGPIVAEAAPERPALEAPREAGDVHAPVEEGRVGLEDEPIHQPEQITPGQPKSDPLLDALNVTEARIAEAEAQIRAKAEQRSSISFNMARPEERRFILDFLKQFSRYTNRDKNVANYVVWDKVAKELKIVRLDKEGLGDRFFAIAGPERSNKMQYARNLYHALKRGYFSKTDITRMWDEHRSQYRTDYVDWTSPDYMRPGVEIEHLDSLEAVNEQMPRKKFASRNTIEEGDLLVLDWGGEYGTFEARVLKRIDKGDLKPDGKKYQNGGFLVRTPDGSERMVKDGSSVEIVPEDAIIEGEGGNRLRNVEMMNLVEAVKAEQQKKMEALGLHMNNDGTFPKRAQLTADEYADLLNRLSSQRNPDGVSNYRIARERRLAPIEMYFNRVAGEVRQMLGDMSNREVDDWLSEEIHPVLERASEIINRLGGKKNLSDADLELLNKARRDYQYADMIEEITDGVIVDRMREMGGVTPNRDRKHNVNRDSRGRVLNDDGGEARFDPVGENDFDPYTGGFIPPDDVSSPHKPSSALDEERLREAARAAAEERLGRKEADLDMELDERADAVYESYINDEMARNGLDPEVAQRVVEAEDRIKAMQDAVDTIWREC